MTCIRNGFFFALVFVIVTAADAGSVGSQPSKLNVVFCFADDWGRYASAYAALDQKPSPNSVVKTPNIDALAAKGVLFRNAFVNSPSCTPCRSSLLSGRFFFNCGRGAILRNAVWDHAIPSFPLLMEQAGYSIGKTGKVWSPGRPADAPFGGQRFAFQQSGMRFITYSQQMTARIERGEKRTKAHDALLTQVRENFSTFLEKRDADKPFLYWFGPTNVHRMWTRGSGKALWGIDSEDLKGKLPAFLPDVPEVREDFADYLGEVQAFDAYVGTIVESLRQAGELDRTLIVISGDHGPPGFPGGKCNLYDFGVRVALIAVWPGGQGGRVVDDFVSMPDLCPTFLEVAGINAPTGLYGKSLVPILKSDRSGQIDPSRNFVICGRERHVDSARAGNMPYPQRSIRTREFLYVRNFAPDRTPMGDPKTVSVEKAPTQEKLVNNTHVAYADMDAGPTKAWLVAHRNDPKWKWHFDYAFGKRPAEEFYDLVNDPDQIKNLADDPKFAQAKQKMAERLMSALKVAGDPRLVEDCIFEKPPFTDLEPRTPAKKEKAKK